MDELGRPVIWHDDRESLRGGENDREKEECRRRVESYLKSSNMSLVCDAPLSDRPENSSLACYVSYQVMFYLLSSPLSDVMETGSKAEYTIARRPCHTPLWNVVFPVQIIMLLLIPVMNTKYIVGLCAIVYYAFLLHYINNQNHMDLICK